MTSLNVPYNDVIKNEDGNTKQNFIRKTYFHLALAITLFAVCEGIMIKVGLGDLALQMLAISKWAWIGVLLVYGFASSIVHGWSLTSVSLEKQYMAWVAGIVLEAVIFLPLIAMAVMKSQDVNILYHASVITTALVAGVTAVVFVTGKDFSFLRPALMMGGFVAMGVIVASIAFGFSLGLIFSGIMMVFASGAILYETSNIQHHYHKSQYVGASLALFSSVGLLFYYAIQFVMSFMGSD